MQVSCTRATVVVLSVFAVHYLSGCSQTWRNRMNNSPLTALFFPSPLATYSIPDIDFHFSNSLPDPSSQSAWLLMSGDPISGSLLTRESSTALRPRIFLHHAVHLVAAGGLPQCRFFFLLGLFLRCCVCIVETGVFGLDLTFG